MKNALAIVVLASCTATASRAASPPAVPEGLLACAKLQDVNERVRCYDAQVAAMGRAAANGSSSTTANRSAPVAAPSSAAAAAPAAAGASAAGAPAITAPASPAAARAPRSAPASARSSAEDSFAAHFGEDTLPLSSRPEPSRKDETLESRITAVRKVGFDTYLISLANGQVWRQDGNQVTFFRAGYAVRIERHPLGSYHMSSPAIGAKNWVYVTRIR